MIDEVEMFSGMSKEELFKYWIESTKKLDSKHPPIILGTPQTEIPFIDFNELFYKPIVDMEEEYDFTPEEMVDRGWKEIHLNEYIKEIDDVLWWCSPGYTNYEGTRYNCSIRKHHIYQTPATPKEIIHITMLIYGQL